MLLNRLRKAHYPYEKELIAALDIGSSKVCCAIAQTARPDQFQVIGVGHQASRGLRSGMIIDMQDTELSILNAIHLAEQEAGVTLRDVYVGVSGCSSQALSLEVPISGRSIDVMDVKRLLALSQNSEKPANHEAIHTIPTSYDIDGRKGIRDPRGMYGEVLGVNIHTVYSPVSNIRNLTTCISRCHLRPRSFVAAPLASGLATLVDDEMDLGIIVIDMGAGTTTVSAFFEGTLIYTDSLPVGGSHVTSDIARVLSTPLAQAERLKTLHGSVLSTVVEEREIVKVPQIGELDSSSNVHQIAKSDLARIIRPRIEETFDLVSKRLMKNGITHRISQRVVLTGGASQLQGVSEVASSILEKQIRLGKPLQIDNLPDTMRGPAFSTCAGLLNFAYMEQEDHTLTHSFKGDSNWTDRLKGWLRENL